MLDSRTGGKRRYLTLARRARAAARRFRPDVVYAHFLVPSGLVAALAGRAPLVVTAHGRDVRNVGAVPGIAALTRATIRRAAAVIAVSDYLRRELEAKVPEARGKTEVIDSGVDLERFTRRSPRPTAARASSVSAPSPSGRTSSGWPRRSSGSARGRSPSSATARCARGSKAARTSSSPAPSRTTRSRRASRRRTSSASRA